MIVHGDNLLDSYLVDLDAWIDLDMVKCSYSQEEYLALMSQN